MKHSSLMTKLAISACFFLFTHNLQAQVRATTASGNKVLLFDNGTWKYDEGGSAPAATQSTTKEVIPATPIAPSQPNAPTQATAAPVAAVNIDKSVNKKTDSFDMFNVESTRLVRFFGEERGKVNCKASAMVEAGEVILCFEWQAPVGDANRYFGRLEEGSKIDVELEGGETITLTYTTQFEAKYMEKYNMSIFKGGFVLTPEQITKFSTNNLRSCVAHWKKKPEEYKLSEKTAIIEALKDLQ